jgi:hypothetical protein
MEENDLVVVGKDVDNIFFPEETLFVSQAEYRFENRTRQIKTIIINSCYFMDNGKPTPVNVFHVYLGDLIIKKVFNVLPNSSLDIRITFPFREVNVGPKFKYGVQLNLECDGNRFSAISNLNIIKEERQTFE